MAQMRPAQAQVSFTKQLVNFTNSVPALDLTLRLIQATTQVASELCIDSIVVKRCSVATLQLGLGE